MSKTTRSNHAKKISLAGPSQLFQDDDGLEGPHQITMIGHHGNQTEMTSYNISDYRTSCRTCKDMEVEAYETLGAKKTYKRGSLLNVPNNGYSKKASTASASGPSLLKPTKPSLDIPKARQMIEDAKGKIASAPRYNASQLKKLSLDQLIQLILLLQDENDRLRAELEKLRLKLSIAEKKSQQVGHLKATVKQNKASLD